MKYLLIMQINPEVMEKLTEEEQNTIMKGHQQLLERLKESGELIVTQALGDPSTSTVVRAKDGVPVAVDGPFLESKEFMGGFYLVDVDSKERAIDIARLIPDTEIDGLAVEVRPVMFSAGPDL